MLLLLALACAPPVDTGAPSDTADPGDTDTGDADTGDTDCTWLPADDRLVLAEGCVDGVCAGTVFVDVVAVWGAPDTCEAADHRATCAWGDVTFDFQDCDGDGAPDPDASICDLFDQTVTIGGAWGGASAEGLGLRVEAACWAEALGGPGPWELGSNPRVTVSVSPSDGLVSEIVLAWTLDE